MSVLDFLVRVTGIGYHPPLARTSDERVRERQQAAEYLKQISEVKEQFDELERRLTSK